MPTKNKPITSKEKYVIFLTPRNTLGGSIKVLAEGGEPADDVWSKYGKKVLYFQTKKSCQKLINEINRYVFNGDWASDKAKENSRAASKYFLSCQSLEGTSHGSQANLKG